MERRQESVFSKKIKAGKRRTYFFDVKETRGKDYFLCITESVKRFDDSGFDRHKMFIYKEDFNKFIKTLQETVDHVKTELMPNFDFDAFNHEYPEDVAFETVETESAPQPLATPITDAIVANNISENVDKW